MQNLSLTKNHGQKKTKKKNVFRVTAECSGTL